MRRLFILLYIVCQMQSVHSINKIDSLKLQLTKAAIADTSKANIYNKIADLFEERASDSCLYYAKMALSISQKAKFINGCGHAYNTIGSYYNGKGEYQLALSNYIDAFKIYEKSSNQKAKSNIMNSIGNTYLGIDNVAKAQESYKQSYEIALADSNRYMMGISSIGLGNIYLLKKDATQAIVFFTRAKDVFQNTPNSLYPLAVSYTLIGDALVELNKFDDAFVNFNKAVEQLKTLNNTYGIAATYKVIGDAYKKKGNLTSALEYFLKSYEIFVQRNAYDDLQSISFEISTIYKQQKKYDRALEFADKHISYKDSVLNTQKNKQLLEVEAKYETEKKEQQNVILRKQNDLSNERIKQQKTLTYIIIASLIVSLLFGVFMFRVYSQKKKDHSLISKQKEQVEQKQFEIEAQKQVIEVKQKEIVDSINYARRIQYALLTNTKFLDKYLPNHFVLFKPKDIVSGDFYWATEYNGKFYLAVCDCTGHGVPGAFMSLLNIGFLSEAIKEKEISEPHQIFNYVRTRLIESIGRDEQRDGMDGILLCFDISEYLSNPQSLEITYVASNNSPVLVKNNQLHLLEKDKMPVGKGEWMESFNLYSVNLQKGDSLYLYTDGYADQFGGGKGKKFKYKPLNKLLSELNTESLTKQQDILNSTFDSWKGNLEQVDDVLIVGIKI